MILSLGFLQPRLTCLRLPRTRTIGLHHQILHFFIMILEIVLFSESHIYLPQEFQCGDLVSPLLLELDIPRIRRSLGLASKLGTHLDLGFKQTWWKVAWWQWTTHSFLCPQSHRVELCVLCMPRPPPHPQLELLTAGQSSNAAGLLAEHPSLFQPSQKPLKTFTKQHT